MEPSNFICFAVQKQPNMKRKFSLMIGCLWMSLAVFAQLTITVTAIPANTPANDTIYIAGTFNNWTADSSDFILSPKEDGTFQISITPPAGLVKFKFTRGSWETVEGNAQGGFQPDHQLQYEGGEQAVALEILSWEGQGGGTGTAADNVFVIDEDFSIPQLNRQRRIWLYLPPDYATSGKSYPVLYMQDGQNLFDANTSFGQEWQVDEALNQLFNQGDEGIIVVGIDNGQGNRLNEYTPWPNPEYGGGQGSEYVDFIVQTLKPYIDANYRTRPQRDFTGIMGSSLGGLISMYAVIEHQDVFSKAGIFSPSFWFTNDIYDLVDEVGKEDNLRVYLLGGINESGGMVPDLNRMYSQLENEGFQAEELQLITHADGQHSEWYWAREFSAAYQWLFANTTPTNTKEPKVLGIKITPNPADSILQFSLPTSITDASFELYAMDGRLVFTRQAINGQAINVAQLEAGTYICKVYLKNKVIGSKKILIAH